jgi:hypothetical protein
VACWPWRAIAVVNTKYNSVMTYRRSDTPMRDVDTELAHLAAGRDAALAEIATAARAAGTGALLLIGSLGRGGGDAWSDLDLIAVPGPDYTRLDLAVQFADRVLASLAAPRNAPIGGSYQGLCLDVADTVLWIDLYLWPAATAMIPTDATAIYDDLALPYSDLAFIPLITAHSDPAAPAPADNEATTLLRVAVAAKYLARADITRLAGKLPEAAGATLDEVPALLRARLAAVHQPQLARAASATGRLVDLAAAAIPGHIAAHQTGEGA